MNYKVSKNKIPWYVSAQRVNLLALTPDQRRERSDFLWRNGKAVEVFPDGTTNHPNSPYNKPGGAELAKATMEKILKETAEENAQRKAAGVAPIKDPFAPAGPTQRTKAPNSNAGTKGSESQSPRAPVNNSNKPMTAADIPVDGEMLDRANPANIEQRVTSKPQNSRRGIESANSIFGPGTTEQQLARTGASNWTGAYQKMADAKKLEEIQAKKDIEAANKGDINARNRVSWAGNLLKPLNETNPGQFGPRTIQSGNYTPQPSQQAQQQRVFDAAKSGDTQARNDLYHSNRDLWKQLPPSSVTNPGQYGDSPRDLVNKILSDPAQAKQARNELANRAAWGDPQSQQMLAALPQIMKNQSDALYADYRKDLKVDYRNSSEPFRPLTPQQLADEKAMFQTLGATEKEKRGLMPSRSKNDNDPMAPLFPKTAAPQQSSSGFVTVNGEVRNYGAANSAGSQKPKKETGYATFMGQKVPAGKYSFK